MKYSALIVAAGSGTRMNLGYNKVYYPIEEGVTILEKTMSVFVRDQDCTQIVVVTDPEDFSRHCHCDSEKIHICRGGSTRQESVANGLAVVSEDYVFVHDGARPFVSDDEIDALKNALNEEDAVLLMVACKDTIKRVDEQGYVVETYDRSVLRAAQTPQAFRTEVLKECMLKAASDGFSGTDDASLVERYGRCRVKAVEGSYRNLKVTTVEDIMSR